MQLMLFPDHGSLSPDYVSHPQPEVNLILQAAGGDAQRAEKLKLWLRSKDLQRLPDSSEVVASVSGHKVQLRRGLHFS